MEQEVGKIGVVMMNVGTPDSPEPGDVRRFLREFLSDPRVLDIHPVGRWMLLNLIILPFRPRKSGKAYEEIWTDEGSPILVHSRRFETKLQEVLGDRYKVRFAMRYGNPSYKEALNEMMEAGVERIIAFPLYPQYASSSTGTCLEAVYTYLGEHWNVPDVASIPPFYDDEAFLQSLVASGQNVLKEFDADHVLFSFHGVPERHVTKSDPSGEHCLKKEDCCASICPENTFCYRAQCFVTARKTAEMLGLAEDQYTVCFQSRLGRTPWIQPYTDVLIPQLAEKGTRRIAVFCPAFVADCLETLEEIGMRAKEDFLEAGGEDLILVPSLNSSDEWVEGARQLVIRADAGAQTSAA